MATIKISNRFDGESLLSSESFLTEQDLTAVVGGLGEVAGVDKTQNPQAKPEPAIVPDSSEEEDDSAEEA